MDTKKTVHKLRKNKTKQNKKPARMQQMYNSLSHYGIQVYG